jgi:gluconate 2-dehydrogenase gamma chain
MSKYPSYPPGSVRTLLTTDHVSPATRSALTNRLQASQQPYTPTAFTEPEFGLLRAICARLTGDDALSSTIDPARTIDQRLAADESDGWRLAKLPPDRLAWRLALRGIDAEAQSRFARPFVHLSGDEQDTILRTVQTGTTSHENWPNFNPEPFLTQMLAEVNEAFYAHPLAQEEIGYVGMADLPSWQAIGLNQLDDREPRPLQDTDAHS